CAAGDNPQLDSSDDFAKLSESIGIAVRPFTDNDFINRFSFTASYQHSNDFARHWDGNDLVEAKLSLALDKKKNFSISLAYTNGTSPLLEQDTNQLVLEL